MKRKPATRTSQASLKPIPRRLAATATAMTIVAGLGFAAPADAALVYQMEFDNQDLTVTGTGVTPPATATLPSGGSSSFSTDTPSPLSPGFSWNAVGVNNRTPILPNSSSRFQLSNAGDKMTIAAWIKWDGTVPGGQTTGIVTKRGWRFFIFDSTDGPKLQFDWKNDGGQGTGLFNGNLARNSIDTVPVDEWVHVALQVDTDAGLSVDRVTNGGNNATHAIRFFINGEDAGLETQAFGGGTLDPVTDSIYLADKFANGNNAFPGLIDDARLYDEILTQEQILAIIPEPGSLGLVAAGGALMFFRRR